MKKMLQRIAQSCLEFDVSDRTVHCMQMSRQELCKFTSSSQDLSIIYLRVVNSHQFNQSDLDTRSWYHGMAASKECLQAPLHTPSSPDRSRLAPLVLDYTRLSRPKPKREPVRRLDFGPGVRFSKAPETIFSPSVSKIGELCTSETSCMKGTSLHIKNTCM